MPGLNLGMMGGVKVGTGSNSSNGGSPSSVTEAAFGPGYASAGTPSTAAALAPNDPFGMAFFAGVAALGLLLFIRHSLPN